MRYPIFVLKKNRKTVNGCSFLRYKSSSAEPDVDCLLDRSKYIYQGLDAFKRIKETKTQKKRVISFPSGPKTYHNVFREAEQYGLFRSLYLTAYSEIHIAELFGTKFKFSEKMDRNLVNRVVKAICKFLGSKFPQTRVQLREVVSNVDNFTIDNLNRIMGLMTEQDLEILAQVINEVIPYDGRVPPSLKLDILEKDNATLNSLFIDTEVMRSVQEELQKFRHNAYEKIEDKLKAKGYTVLRCLGLLSSRNVLINENLIGFLIEEFNKSGLHNYTKVILSFLDNSRNFHVNDYILGQIFQYTELSDDKSRFFSAIQTILGDHSTSQLKISNLFVQYVHSAENSLNSNSLQTSTLGPSDLIPPLSIDANELFKDVELLIASNSISKNRKLSIHNHPQYIRVSLENNEQLKALLIWEKCPTVLDTQVAYGRLKDPDTNINTIFETTSFSVITNAMDAAISFGLPNLVDLLVYKTILGSYFLSYTGPKSRCSDDYLRVNLNIYDLPKELLAANNLSNDFDMNSGKPSSSNDFNRLFSPKFLELYLTKIHLESQREGVNEDYLRLQLHWVVKLLDVIYLTPLMFKVTERISKMAHEDRKAFGRKYDNFFDIEDIIRFEMIQSMTDVPNRNSNIIEILEERKESFITRFSKTTAIDFFKSSEVTKPLTIIVLEKVYYLCFHLGEYHLIKNLEKLKVDFDKIVQDAEFRKQTKSSLDRLINEQKFKKANNEWKSSEGKIGLRSLFISE